MSLDQAIYDATLANSTIAQIVDTRVFPQFVPQGESGAAVTYQIISGDDDDTCDGPVGLPDIRVQITAWSARFDSGGTREQCDELFTALLDTWKYYVGTVGGITIQGTRIVRRADSEEGFDDNDQNAQRWGRFIDVMISYEE